MPGIGLVSAARRRAIITDPNFANTILLISASPTTGSKTFTDASAAARGSFTASGVANDAQSTNTATLFGANVIRFDSAANDFIEFPDHADWTLGTSNVTIELYYKPDANNRTEALISHYNATGSQRGWQMQYTGGAATKALRFFGSSTGGTIDLDFSGNFTASTGVFNYLCYERSGNTHRLYAGQVGGSATMIAKTTNSLGYFNSTAALRIGSTANGADNVSAANMNEIRITAGVARYNTDAGFAVPSAPWPRS